MESRSLIAPPRLAAWLLSAAVPGVEGEVVAGDLHEEFCAHILPTRGRRRARWWYCWQVARSMTPLIRRSWERAAVRRASLAVIAAGAVAALPAAALVTLRSFVLSQVPLKTDATVSMAFAVTLAMAVAATTIAAIGIAVRVLARRG